jgi:hypothetical protein
MTRFCRSGPSGAVRNAAKQVRNQNCGLRGWFREAEQGRRVWNILAALGDDEGEQLGGRWIDDRFNGTQLLDETTGLCSGEVPCEVTPNQRCILLRCRIEQVCDECIRHIVSRRGA